MSKATQEPTRILADFAAGLRYDDLPQRAREHCKNLVLDALACALAGYQGEETDQVRGLASALAQGTESSVIGGAPLSLVGATLFNGYLITAVTMVVSSGAEVICRTNDWSIFSASIGNLLR